jgi:phytoene dehydrogenase-like protein
MARAGCRVLVLEANADIGGGVRSAELTLPGLTHDLCSSIYPFGPGSPFFRNLPLSQHGLEWIHPPLLLAIRWMGEAPFCWSSRWLPPRPLYRKIRPRTCA